MMPATAPWTFWPVARWTSQSLKLGRSDRRAASPTTRPNNPSAASNSRPWTNSLLGLYRLMTAATAILGLLPMVLLRLDGTEIERPLAIALIGGLVTSTLFTLLALPAFYTLAHQLGHRNGSGR